MYGFFCNQTRLVPNLKGQYSREKCWWKRKSCFIQEASSWGRWQTNVLRPSPSCWLGVKDFKGSGRDGAAGCMFSLCTILGLVGVKVKFRASPIFWFQPVWGLRAWGQQFSAGVGGGCLCKNNLGVCVRPLSISFRELGVS